MANIIVRNYDAYDIPEMARIWNEVVAAGDAFPQDAPLAADEAVAFFAAQTHCGVAVVGECGEAVYRTIVCECGNGGADPDGAQGDCGNGTDLASAQGNYGNGTVAGLYILHPNNVGRCGHIANASYAVRGDCRGEHIGEALVKDCLGQAVKAGYRVLQFNAVVAANTHARHLYERLGFTQLGTIKGGFRLGPKDGGNYVDICPYYISLV